MASMRRRSSGQKTGIVTHHHLRFQLPDGVKHHADHDQHGGRRYYLAAAGTGTCEVLHKGYNAQENGPGQCNTIQDRRQIPAGWLAWPVTWNEGTLFLQILWNVLLLPHHVRIEVGEGDYQQTLQHPVPPVEWTKDPEAHPGCRRAQPVFVCAQVLRDDRWEEQH